MNFDMLQAIVQEMNLYDEDPQDVLKWLNARPEFGAMNEFDVVELTVGGKPIKKKSRSRQWFGNPTASTGVSIKYRKKVKPATKEETGDKPKGASVIYAEELVSLSSHQTPYDWVDDDADEDDDAPEFSENRGYGDNSVVELHFSPAMLDRCDGSKGKYMFYNAEANATLSLQKRMT